MSIILILWTIIVLSLLLLGCVISCLKGKPWLVVISIGIFVIYLAGYVAGLGAASGVRYLFPLGFALSIIGAIRLARPDSLWANKFYGTQKSATALRRFPTPRKKIVDARPEELRALWLGFAFHFIILTAYYIVKPIRDSIAASGRLETLPWMFTATLIVMLIANAIYAAIVARMERRKFIPFAYAFFILVLLLFFVLMRTGSPAQQVWTGRAFYVWVSVFNLFNTAIFWAFMTDLFTVEQGKRLYGFIAVGGTLGAIVGAYITKNFIRGMGPANLIAISAAMFAIVCVLVRFFPSNFAAQTQVVPAREEPIGGGVWAGFTHIARSPYLFGLAAVILLYTITSTWAYFQQTTLAGAALKTSADRTVFLSSLEIWVNTLTLFIQIFLTGRFLKWFGVAFTLTALPFLSMLGFAAMAIAPSLAMLAFFQVTRRAGAYALMRPSREILFTVLKREDKYKVKSITDTLGYRVGDQLGAWSYGGLGPNGLHLSLNAISWIAVPITAGWCVLSLWLARKQRELADAQTRRDQTPRLGDVAPEPA